MKANFGNNQLYTKTTGNELLIKSTPNDYNSNNPKVSVPQNQETPQEPNSIENKNKNDLVQYSQNNQLQNQNFTPEEQQITSVPYLPNNENTDTGFTKRQIIIRIIFIILLILYLIYDIIAQVVINGKINIGIVDDGFLLILGIIIFIFLLLKKQIKNILLYTLGLLACIIGTVLKMIGIFDGKKEMTPHEIILFVIRFILFGFIFYATIPKNSCRKYCLGCKLIWNNKNNYGY